MNLPNLKELNKFITLCKKHGITSAKVGEIELQFSPDSQETRYIRPKRGAVAQTQDSLPEHSGPTIDELIDWSASGPVFKQEN